MEYKSFRLSESMIGYCSFDEKITCLDSRRKDFLVNVAAATATGEIFVWEIDAQNVVKSKTCEIPSTEPKRLSKHKTEITSLAFNSTATKLASCSVDKMFCVTDVVTGMNLFSKVLENSPTSLSWCGESEFILIVDVSGHLAIWNLLEGNLKCDITATDGNFYWIITVT